MSSGLRILNMPDVDDPSVARASAPRALGRWRASSLYPCVGCHGKCCRYRVHVMAVEAFRIAMVLGVPIDDIVERMPFEAPNARQLDSVPLYIDGKPIMLELYRPLSTHRCVFAMDVRGQGRCGIYGLRPALCRLYPYNFELDGRNVRTGSQEVCPVTWLKDAAAEERLAESFQAWRKDHAREEKLLAGWHALDGAGDWPAFVQFAGNEMMRWLKMDPRMFEPRRPPELRKLGRAWW